MPRVLGFSVNSSFHNQSELIQRNLESFYKLEKIHYHPGAVGSFQTSELGA